jgi:dTDP-4-amino-4,6-dideoxygalactose transaminase
MEPMTGSGPRRRVPVAKPWFDEREEELVLSVLRSGWVTQGPRVLELEQRFAEVVGAREAVAVSSGTTALSLSLHALGIGPGDEVIVPSLSFIATANAVRHAGATPVFADVEARTYNLEPAEVEALVTPRTRAVLLVHQLGLPADLDAFRALAGRHGLALVEDAACAVGARHRARPIGSSAQIACFSLHARKVVVSGEGGVITTDDSALADRLRRLRHQGMSVSDLERHAASHVIVETYPEVGFNYRLSDLHAAVALAQLEKLEVFLDRRWAIAARYDEALARLPGLERPVAPGWATPNHQSYIVRVVGAERAQRDRLMDDLHARGVATRRGLMAAHLERAYADGLPLRRPLPRTEAAEAQTLILPMYPQLELEDQAFVIEQLAEAVGQQREGRAR